MRKPASLQAIHSLLSFFVSLTSLAEQNVPFDPSHQYLFAAHQITISYCNLNRFTELSLKIDLPCADLLFDYITDYNRPRNTIYHAAKQAIGAVCILNSENSPFNSSCLLCMQHRYQGYSFLPFPMTDIMLPQNRLLSIG